MNNTNIRLLINLATLKKGGGQNVALNFLESLKRVHLQTVGFDFYFVVVKGTPIEHFLKTENNYTLITMPSNPIRRMIVEIFKGKYILKKYNINIIYSYFGVGLYPKSIPQISGSADSNIYFPEIDFWSDYSGLKKLSKYLIDNYRIWGLKRMTAVIFENDSLRLQGYNLFNLRYTTFIKPSINIEFSNNYKPIKIGLPKSLKKGLFFCGWQRNKNYLIIPELAAELKRRNILFHFLITAPLDNSSSHLEFEKKMSEYDVNDFVTILGNVSKEQISALYDNIDIVFLLSRLESFSNNIIEAWYFKKPLLVSDEKWSRSICKDAAIYVPRDNISIIVNTIQKLILNKNLYDSLVQKGIDELVTYPKIDEKTIQELEFIRKVYENY